MLGFLLANIESDGCIMARAEHQIDLTTLDASFVIDTLAHVPWTSRVRAVCERVATVTAIGQTSHA